ncbi:MAG: winged helix-turn-helix domain-containing protein [Micrococcales bacterium]|nr:winged helix-turn-helix domain-containing protein [Micrococcales bacterium]
MDRIRVFGATTVVVGGREVTGPALGGIKPRQVLELLALAGGAPVSKDRLVDLLWGEDAPASARATLESYVCVARRAIAPGGSGRSSVVQTTCAGYRLDTSRITVDLGECRALLSRASTAPAAECVRLVRRALVLSEHPLLATESRAGWADLERDAFGHGLAAACTTAARAALTLGDTDAGLELSERAAGLAPLDEAAVRIRMAALVGSGRRAEAIECFLALRRRLVGELGVEPEPATRSAYVDLLTDRSDEPGRHPTRGEVSGLLELLRETLTRVPGLDPGPVERALAGVASQALQLL